MKTGDRVKYSEYALRNDRHYWLNCGQYAQKSAAKEALERKQAQRGTIVAVVDGKWSQSVLIKWDSGAESNTLPYLVELS